MDKKKWQRWVMQTATKMEDLEGVIKDTGIERIDREHQRLVEYIIEMGEAGRFSQPDDFNSEKLAGQTLLFNRFLNAIKTHFETEGYFIKKYDLDRKKVQEKEHDSIMDQFDKIFRDFENGILSSFQTVRINLLSELIGHINRVDCHTFLLDNFLPTLKAAEKWEDVSEIIKTTGLPFVDQEHHSLTERFIHFKLYLSGINHNIGTEADKAETIRLLNDLFKYTQIHFSHEEEFLDTYELDEANQVSQHGRFLGTVQDLISKIERDIRVDLEGFIEFLFSWWVNHINGLDYVEYHFSKIAVPVFKKSTCQEDFEWLIRKTGILQIDKEHAQLIGQLLKLETRINRDDRDAEGIKKALRSIAAFAGRHFEHEEKIMADKGLGGLDVHADAHRKLLSHLQSAMDHAVSGRSQISPAFMERIMGWWVDHTNGIDYDTFVLHRNAA